MAESNQIPDANAIIRCNHPYGAEQYIDAIRSHERSQVLEEVQKTLTPLLNAIAPQDGSMSDSALVQTEAELVWLALRDLGVSTACGECGENPDPETGIVRHRASCPTLDSHSPIEPEGQATKDAATMLREFHSVFAHPDTDALWLRPTLHREEHAELIEALEDAENAPCRASHEQVARELADVVYIAYGTALLYGIDLDAALREVHRANLSKLGDDGQPIRRDDGKVLKGPNFSPPDMSVALTQPSSNTAEPQ
jgi:NTP pyrophosphatase (non-canonical NTP hydrolase)